MIEKIKETIRHPLTMAMSAATVFGFAIEPALLKALLAAIWASAGTIFTTLSIGTFTLPKIYPTIQPWVPFLKAGLAVAAVVYVSKLLYRIFRKFEARL